MRFRPVVSQPVAARGTCVAAVGVADYSTGLHARRRVIRPFRDVRTFVPLPLEHRQKLRQLRPEPYRVRVADERYAALLDLRLRRRRPTRDTRSDSRHAER